MSYTDKTLANDAFEKLKAINPASPESLIPRLVTMIPAALIQMAERISRSSLADLLRATFTTTAVAGIAPLGDLVDASVTSEPLLIESKLEVFLVGTPYAAEPVPDRATLQIEESVEFPFYCIEGLNILVRQANEEFGTYSDDVTIIGSRIPLSSTIPLQLQGEAVSILVSGLMPQGA